jgi:spermidine synthase
VSRRVLGLFFVSGALGLGYQVLWSKVLLQFVGVSSWSYAIVLAAFMGGLALGSRLFGNLADRVRSPLRLFGLLEIGVGLYAVAYTPLAHAVGAAYERAVAATPQEAGGVHGLLAKAVVAGLLLIPPTTLMGGTYPAMLRHATTSRGEIGRWASKLYAVNAGGAVLGALGMAFVMLPALGITSSLMLLAVGNAFIGGTAWLLSTRPRAVATPTTPEPAPDLAIRAASVRVVLALALAAGFLSFCLEVAWTRVFAMILGSSTYSFAAILAAFIAGIALGSALLVRLQRRLPDALLAFGFSELIAGALVLLPLPLLPYLPWALGRAAHDLPGTDAGFRTFELMKLSACLLVMLLPAVFLGVSIPLLVRATTRGLARLGHDAGRVYAWNTTGNVLGALAAGLVLLPALGVERFIGLSAAALLLVGVAAILACRPTRMALLVAAGATLGVLIFRAAAPAWNPAWFTLTPYRRQFVEAWEATREAVADREILLSVDDPATNLMVLTSRKLGRADRALLVNGKPDASTHHDMSMQVLVAHVPLLLHPDPKSVMLLGLASGVSAGAVLRHPVERLDIVDIVAAMPQAAAHFAEWNDDPLDDPRTRLIIDDARSYLSTVSFKYDVILAEPSNPWTAGTGSLFAREFYEKAAARLQPGGYFVQWYQTYEVSDATLSAAMRSFRSVFPYVVLLEGSTLDTMAIGSFEPITPDVARMRERMARPAVAEHLARWNVHDVDSLLYLQRASPVTFDWMASQVGIENTDDNLLLEQQAPRDLFRGAQPEMLDRLDERSSMAPSLWFAGAVRADRAGTDVHALVDMLARRTFASRELFRAEVAGGVRAGALDMSALAPEVKALLPEPAIPSHADLAQRLDGAMGSGDTHALIDALREERSAILVECLLSDDASREWQMTLSLLIARVQGIPRSRLQLMLADVLATSGASDQALRVLRSVEDGEPAPSAEEIILRTCRVDPGDACTQAARRELERTRDPVVARFLEWRAPPPPR